MERVRKTKIVCTLGPASTDEGTLRKMIFAGMDVARINLSHGTHEEHHARIQAVRAAAEKEEKVIALLGDLGGPKIRLGEVAAGSVELKTGQSFKLTTRNVPGDEREVSVNYGGLPSEVREGETILLADGALELRVLSKDQTDVTCDVTVGGRISSRKGVNLPSTRLKISAVTEKDKVDIAFAVQEKLDYLAVSFVRKAQDVKDARAVLEQHATSIPIISKIEKPEALLALPDIIDVSDGIMVARGDLGVEIPLERVPVVQKEIIRKTRMLGKPVITENLTIINCQVSGFVEGTLLDGTMQPANGNGRIKFGTEANGGFRNVTIANCTFRGCRGLALEEVDGGIMENISINNTR